MNTATDTPVLFLVFNRIEPTRLVHEAIAKARPRRLYVAADGPRADRPEEAGLCRDVRALASTVNWPCEVHTLFRDENLGCGAAIASALDWFFEAEEEGIILEDDCLPAPDFFRFCTALLSHHREDARVMTISGSRYGVARGDAEAAYFYSHYPQCWGWATWRRTWQAVDFEIAEWPSLRESHVLGRLRPDNPDVERYWRDIFDRLASGAIDTWDYQLCLAMWSRGSMTCVPTTNLISNLGFGDGATHTRKDDPMVSAQPTGSVASPLTHPAKLEADTTYDQFIEDCVYRVGAKPRRRDSLLGSRTLRRVVEELKGLRRRLRRT